MRPENDVAFLSPLIDALLVGGLSVVVYFVFGFSRLWAVDLQIAQVAMWASALSWVINYPHFSATIWRLYARRETRQEFKWTTWWSPVIALSGLLLCYLDPSVMAPLWAKFFILWSGYHFSAQSLGFALLYMRRDSFEITRGERMALGLLVFAPYFGSSLINETAQTGASYFALTFPTLGLPLIYKTLAQVLVYASLLMGVLALVRAMDRRERWPHFLVFVPIVSQWIWFWVGKQTPEFNYFVPAFHSLQYLAIAAYVRGVELQTEDAAAESSKSDLRKQPQFSWSVRTLAWYGLNIVGGALLFWFFPHSMRRLGEWLAPGSVYSQEGWVIPVVLATVQVHHFFVDGVIWKLRHASVREALMRSRRLFGSPAGRVASMGWALLLVSPMIAQQAGAEEGSERKSSQAGVSVSARGSSRVLDPEHNRQKLSAERVLLRTDFGDLVLVFYPEVAPLHVERMLALARQKAWVGREFPRLVPGFVLQIQELPEADLASSLGSLRPLKAELSQLQHVRGVLSMARKPEDRDSARTSWSVLLGAAPHLDRDYTIFGRIDRGGRVLELIESLAVGTEGSRPWFRLLVRDVRILKSGADGESLLPEDFQDARLPAELVKILKSNRPGAEVRPPPAPSLSWTMLIMLFALVLGLVALNPPQFLAQAVGKSRSRWQGLVRYLQGLSILLLAFAVATLAYQSKWQESWTSGLIGGLSLLVIWLGFRSVSGLEQSQVQSLESRRTRVTETDLTTDDHHQKE